MKTSCRDLGKKSLRLKCSGAAKPLMMRSAKSGSFQQTSRLTVRRRTNISVTIRNTSSQSRQQPLDTSLKLAEEATSYDAYGAFPQRHLIKVTRRQACATPAEVGFPCPPATSRSTTPRCPRRLHSSKRLYKLDSEEEPKLGNYLPDAFFIVSTPKAR